MRLGLRATLPLAACAAAAAAAAAHLVIDIVGDYALAHDTFDDVSHSSRELISGIALLLACLLAGRGLRICCEVAATYRYRLPQAAFSSGERMCFIFSNNCCQFGAGTGDGMAGRSAGRRPNHAPE